jgi:hypothetical protein
MQYGVMGQVFLSYFFCGIMAGQGDHLLRLVVMTFSRA